MHNNGTGPASGPQLRSLVGETRDGQPLSVNRAPCAELTPWIARLYATQIEAPEGQSVSCGLVGDTAILRVLFKGDWTAQTRDGRGQYRQSALFFGAQTRRMEVSVTGSFATLGVSLKPGAVAALNGPDMTEALDRIYFFDDLFPEFEWGTSETMLQWMGDRGPPERWLRVAEKLFLQLVGLNGRRAPHPIVGKFDKAAFMDPNLRVAEFAEQHAMEPRRFERIIKRAYGSTPKHVLRRARALDMASHLLGVADSAEADEAALRYFDDSHRNKEFQAFFGMTPRVFSRTPQPLMRLTLEARQARRLELLGRLAEGQKRPWE